MVRDGWKHNDHYARDSTKGIRKKNIVRFNPLARQKAGIRVSPNSVMHIRYRVL